MAEDCPHDVEAYGLCAYCGKDMTEVTPHAPITSKRPNIRMSHDTSSVLVSLSEASRLESISAKALHDSRRLSLIVDLDQTIVHATVDPTVGEWMAECGLLPESKDQLSNGSKHTNPNEAALRDVGRFKLGASRPEDDYWYYIKPRPGLPQFLSSLSKLYEMHVYTMGTRAYAEKVCGVIDPDGKIFGRRILSRDESGSLTAKSIARLFPVDTSMVVIIDDRADVWEGSRNLVKVIPYDFFVGIGDINSSFLPTLTPPPVALKPSSASTADEGITLNTPTPDEAAAAQAHIIEDQIGERSLAKRQEELQEAEEAAETPAAAADAPHHHQPKALLKDDDVELERLDGILREIHRTYYRTRDRLESAKTGSSSLKAPTEPELDVKVILDRMKAEIFAGCNILFSGLIAIGERLETSYFWKQARTYGATCSANLSSSVTHLLAKELGTQKVHAALQPPYRNKVHILHPAWLPDSIAMFRRLPEADYRLVPPSTSPTSSPPPSSSASARPTQDQPPVEPEEVVEELHAGDLAAEVDWNQADKELDDYLNASDSEEDGDGDDDSDAESVASVSSRRSTSARKRARPSSTASESGSGTPLPPSSSSLATPSKRARIRAPDDGEDGADDREAGGGRAQRKQKGGDDDDADADDPAETAAKQHDDDDDDDNPHHDDDHSHNNKNDDNDHDDDDNDDDDDDDDANFDDGSSAVGSELGDLEEWARELEGTLAAG